MAKRCELTGVGVMTGNNVSKSNRRTRRDFLPNLKEITLKSDALKANITLRIAAATLRTINKYGGFDSFIINYRFCKLTDTAKKLRRRVEKALVSNGNFDNVKIIRKAKSKKATA